MTNKQHPRFQVWCYSRSAANDKAVRDAAKVDDFGSGTCFMSGFCFGIRDISFFAASKAKAISMKNRLLKVEGVSHVDVIDSQDDKRKTYKVKKS